ncbi:MAG: chalcone isomerase family protein [Pseudomonadota bacterium]|nr:chalcone isomerase family protein [Pseudomonadota bacterium]
MLLAFLFCVAQSFVAHGASLAGVTLPDTATVADQPLVLNGMGLREKYFIDIYVGGLYLDGKSSDAVAALQKDAPKRMVMQFVYGRVTREQMLKSFLEDFGKQPGVKAHQANVDKMMAAVPDELLRGDQIVFEYAPGVGTTLVIKGKPAVTVPGVDFMRMAFGIWLGPTPPTAALKAGLLGQ